MKHHPTPGLPRFDAALLRIVATAVPASEREQWLRAWHAELWHLHHPRRTQGLPSRTSIADLAAGLALDGLWLRMESWRCGFSGTARLCIGTLLGLNALSALGILGMQDNWHLLAPCFAAQLTRSLVSAPLVLLVAVATTSTRHVEAPSRRSFRFKQQLFSIAQVLQVLLLAFLSSADVSLPIHAQLPGTSDLLQMLCFVLFSLVGLRWALPNQEHRCKQCLRSLTTPARIGRPSHNLLEWNGTARICSQGHGQLSVPEIETSWCQSSQWTDLDVA